MAIGKQIKLYRTQLGWKLKQLSAAADVDIGTISALESRDSDRSEFLLQIAKAFGLTVEELADESKTYVARPPSLAVNQPTPNYKLQQHDQWTAEAVAIFGKLSDADKRGALANLKTYVQNLTPQDGQNLSVAA